MVRLHVKKGDESQFLHDTRVDASVDDVVRDVVAIYNGRLKISRICYGKKSLFARTAMYYARCYGTIPIAFYEPTRHNAGPHRSNCRDLGILTREIH